MIAVTGATGHLGRLAIARLLARGVRAAEIVAAVRTPHRATDLATRGVQVRRADYDDPETLATAFTGVDQLLFVSSSEVGRRVGQHRHVVDAARGAGVRLVAYTSITRADSTQLLIAGEHRATEEMIRESDVPFVFLRNAWYLEVYTGQMPNILDQGAIFGCADDGRVSAAARADYADAAAAVLTSEGHENHVYELGGDEAFTMPQLAAEIARQSGRPITYRDLTPDAFVLLLIGAGIPEPLARLLADNDLGVARGDLFVDTHDLSRLIGHPTTPMPRAVADALALLQPRDGAAHPTAARD